MNTDPDDTADHTRTADTPGDEVDGPRWRQLTVACQDPATMTGTGEHQLGPLLRDAAERGDLARWWFVRKAHTWRIRIAPTAPRTDQPARDDLRHDLGHDLPQRLAELAGVVAVTEQIYEPEVVAFGGAAGIDIAHELFAHDTAHLVAHLGRTGVGTACLDPHHEQRHRRSDHRRELAMVLAGRLLQGAGLDWYEQGDVWRRVRSHRVPAHPDPTASDLSNGAPGEAATPQLARAVAALLTATVDTPASPLYEDPDWAAGFIGAGRALRDLHDAGHLERGLRAVLAHHLLFLFNRHGLSGRHQHQLAGAACAAVFGEALMTPCPDPAAHATSDSGGNTGGDSGPDQSAVTLRDALAERVSAAMRVAPDARVDTALRTVFRHQFLPGVELAAAYSTAGGTRPVVTRRGRDGASTSSASKPSLVAEMLALAHIEPGHRVLEIGAATGFNAALLAELVAPGGQVSTVELDHDLATAARDALTRAGYDRVRVIAGDGALGDPDTAPFDRILVTAGAWDVPTPWWQQLRDGGRVVVPLRLHASGLTRVIAADHTPHGLVSTTALVCGFVPMRGITEHADRPLDLGGGVALALGDDPAIEESDGGASAAPDQRGRLGQLADALRHDPYTRWTGIHTRDDEPVEHLDLWLLSHTEHAFARLSLSASARSDRRVTPARRWGGVTLHDHSGTLAYLTARAIDDDTEELGVTAHGPHPAALTDHLLDLLARWNTDRPTTPTITITPTTPADPTSLAAGPPRTAFPAARDACDIQVTW